MVFRSLELHLFSFRFAEEPPSELVEKSRISQPFYHVDMKVAVPALGTLLTVSVVVCAAFVCLKRSENALFYFYILLLLSSSSSVYTRTTRYRTGRRRAKPEGRARPEDDDDDHGDGQPEILRDHTQGGLDELRENTR